MIEETILIQIRLPKALHSQSEARANLLGKSLQELVQEALEMKLQTLETQTITQLTSAAKVKALLKWTANHSSDTPILSDYAITRESIYGERY